MQCSQAGPCTLRHCTGGQTHGQPSVPAHGCFGDNGWRMAACPHSLPLAATLCHAQTGCMPDPRCSTVLSVAAAGARAAKLQADPKRTSVRQRRISCTHGTPPISNIVPPARGSQAGLRSAWRSPLWLAPGAPHACTNSPGIPLYRESSGVSDSHTLVSAAAAAAAAAVAVAEARRWTRPTCPTRSRA